MNKDIDKLMKYVDGIDETGVLDEIGEGEIPPIDKGFSTATREKFYKEIGMKWDIGSNTVVGEEIWERRYIELTFNEEEAYVREYKIDEYDEELKGKEFYRVGYEFYEDIYKGVKPFIRWIRERMIWYQEIFYHNKKSKTLRWDRPFREIRNPDGSSQIYYENLIIPYIKNIDINKALGIVIRSDSVFNLEIGESIYTGIKESPKISPVVDEKVKIVFSNISNQILINWIEVKEIDGGVNEFNEIEKIYIEEVWNRVDGEATPKYIEIDLYGMEEAGRRYHPKGEDESYRETLIHSRDRGYKDRLSPPGKVMEGEYWNIEDIKKTSKRFKGSKERRYKEPSWE